MRRRKLLWLGLAVAGLVMAALAASVYVLVEPKIDRPKRADAVVVLSGDRGGRFPRARALVRSGVAPVLVIDGLPDLPEAKALCQSSPDFETVCLRPEPDTTRTEARVAAELASQRNWRRVVIVTDTVHIQRARLLFDRCVNGSVDVVAADPVPGVGITWRRVAHEWLAVLDALVVARSC